MDKSKAESLMKDLTEMGTNNKAERDRFIEMLNVEVNINMYAKQEEI